MEQGLTWVLKIQQFVLMKILIKTLIKHKKKYAQLKYFDDYIYHKDLYEQWVGGLFTKVILEAKNENQMNKIIEKAKEANMIENEDFFCIRDACLTELTPDETGTRWTCIGFKPMDASVIDPITKKLQLFKD